MTEKTDFLLRRVAEEQALAKVATLENVRRSHLRSVEAWQKLADRSAKADTVRAEDAARKAERDLERLEASADQFRNEAKN